MVKPRLSSITTHEQQAINHALIIWSILTSLEQGESLVVVFG